MKYKYKDIKSNVQNHEQKKKKTLDTTKKLFDCFYKMKYEIDMAGFKEEKQEKFILSEQLRKNKTKGVHKIEQNLLYEPDISIHTFQIICELNNLKFIIVNGIMYMEGGAGSDAQTIIEQDGGGYKIIEKKNNYDNDNKFWKVGNIEKPLKSFSNYKAIELRKIGKLLGLNINKTEKKFKTKKEIYEMILQKIS